MYFPKTFICIKLYVLSSSIEVMFFAGFIKKAAYETNMVPGLSNRLDMTDNGDFKSQLTEKKGSPRMLSNFTNYSCS